MSKPAVHGEHACLAAGHRKLHKYVQKVCKGQSDCPALALPKENCPTALKKANDASKIPYLKQGHFQLKGTKTHTHTNKQKNPCYCVP